MSSPACRRPPVARQRHLRQPVAVGGHHPHLRLAQLPEHPVQDRARLLGGDREGDVRDELLQLLPGQLPALLEGHRGEGRELVLGQPVQPEARTAARDGDGVALRGDVHRVRRQLAGDLLQLARGRGDRPRLLHLRRHPHRHRRVQVRPAEADPRPSSVSSRRFESTGRVVRVGMLPATAARPSCSFSRVMVNFMAVETRCRVPLPGALAPGAPRFSTPEISTSS